MFWVAVMVSVSPIHVSPGYVGRGRGTGRRAAGLGPTPGPRTTVLTIVRPGGDCSARCSCRPSKDRSRADSSYVNVSGGLSGRRACWVVGEDSLFRGCHRSLISPDLSPISPNRSLHRSLTDLPRSLPVTDLVTDLNRSHRPISSKTEAVPVTCQVVRESAF